MNDEAVRMVGKARGENEVREELLARIRGLRNEEKGLRWAEAPEDRTHRGRVRAVLAFLEDLYERRFGARPAA